MTNKRKWEKKIKSIFSQLTEPVRLLSDAVQCTYKPGGVKSSLAKKTTTSKPS